MLSMALNIAVCVLPQSATAANCSKQDNWGKAESCNTHMAWTYNPKSSTFESAGTRTSVGDLAGDKYVYESFNVCSGDSEGPDCAAAHNCLPLTDGGSRGTRVGVVRWLMRPDGTKTPGAGEHSSACEYPLESIPLANVEALARQRLEKAVSHPTITVAPPGGKTLVNIPTIFSAPEPKPITLTIITPVPGTIAAVPEYTWDFDDGLTGVGAGMPYSSSLDPVEHPDSYLHAVYLGGGTKHITATLTWHVTFTLEGNGSVDLAPIVFTQTADIQAMTAKARLYNH
jgi:hypothetical protein